LLPARVGCASLFVLGASRQPMVKPHIPSNVFLRNQRELCKIVGCFSTLILLRSRNIKSLSIQSVLQHSSNRCFDYSDSFAVELSSVVAIMPTSYRFGKKSCPSLKLSPSSQSERWQSRLSHPAMLAVRRLSSRHHQRRRRHCPSSSLYLSSLNPFILSMLLW
jgi:hypothetical protein